MHDPRILVGAATGDDAGVFRLDKDRALVQTADFFTPIVDDPYTYGQIAVANSLSDVYAMGGRPITALNLLGIPEEAVPPPVVNTILRGGLAKAKQAGCRIIGGHTIRNAEPFYGLSVTGVVSPRRMITNARACPGDYLVLTKPLGTGIVATAIKKGITSAALERRSVRAMCRLNDAGALLAERGLVRAGTDVTGFGLLGHLSAMCRASGVGAEIWVDRVPVLADEVRELIRRDCVPGGTRANLKTAAPYVDWGETTLEDQLLLADAQTSGGLLLCVAGRHAEKTLEILRKARTVCLAVIGRITRADRGRLLVVRRA